MISSHLSVGNIGRHGGNESASIEIVEETSNRRESGRGRGRGHARKSKPGHRTGRDERGSGSADIDTDGHGNSGNAGEAAVGNQVLALIDLLSGPSTVSSETIHPFAVPVATSLPAPGEPNSLQFNLHDSNDADENHGSVTPELAQKVFLDNPALNAILDQGVIHATTENLPAAPSAVPETNSIILLASVLAGLGWARRSLLKR